jgi:cell division protein FtsZ
MNNEVQTPPAAGNAVKNISVRIFGVGGAGVSVLDQVLKSDLAGTAFAAMDTNAHLLAASSAPEKMQVAKKSLRGRVGGGTGRGQSAAEEPLTKLKANFAGADVVFILAGLGGRTGTELSAALAAQAKETGAMVLAFVTLPFNCEGSLRRQSAEDGLKQLEAVADAVICLPNQKTCALIGEATSLVDTFKVANRLLADCVRGVWRALLSASVMGLPFSDLCVLLDQRSAGCAFAAAEAAGAKRADEVVEKLLAHPMLDGGRVLQQAETILVSVVGGPDLAMAEVDRVMDRINRLCQGVPVVMGAGIAPSFKGSLAVVLLVARHGEMTDNRAVQSEASDPKSSRASKSGSSNLDTQLLARAATARPHSRFVPPPPALTPEQREQFIAKQTGAHARQWKDAARLRQTQLPLEIVSKGRFDKSEPTIHKGEDLDVPTYIRRGVALN